MYYRNQSFYVLSSDDVDRIKVLLETVQQAVHSIIFAKQVKYSNNDPECELPSFEEEQILLEKQRLRLETLKPSV